MKYISSAGITNVWILFVNWGENVAPQITVRALMQDEVNAVRVDNLGVIVNCSPLGGPNLADIPALNEKFNWREGEDILRSELPIRTIKLLNYRVRII